MIEESVHEFELNNPQARVLTVMANETWCLWSRGTGKSQGVIAPWVLHKVEHMPQSTGGFLGASFADIETKYLKPLFTAFGMMKHREDIDYVYGKEPRLGWKKPYIPVIDYSHVISFPNGTSIESISLHKKGSANALSVQWIVGDEAKFLNPQKLTEEVSPILRGNADYFGDSPWYGAKLMVSDKLSPSIHWLLEKKKLMDSELVEAIIFFQLKMNELIKEIGSASGNRLKVLKRKARDLDAVLATLRRKCVMYSEAKAIENVKNLRESFFESQRRTLTEYEYRVMIDNEDPRRVENCFYSGRTEHHLHTSFNDQDPTLPVGVAFDYQHSITPLVAFQVNGLMGGYKTLNFLQSPHVKAPLGLKHAINNFCEHQQHRPCKHVLYFYNHTAIGKKHTDDESFKEQVVRHFKANDWKVTEFYSGGAPLHNVKHKFINDILEEESEALFPVRMHEHRCATLIMSMDQTATILSPTEGIKKDKSLERKNSIPQEQTTHFGDVFDDIVWAVNKLNMYPMHQDNGGVFVGVR